MQLPVATRLVRQYMYSQNLWEESSPTVARPTHRFGDLELRTVFVRAGRRQSLTVIVATILVLVPTARVAVGPQVLGRFHSAPSMGFGTAGRKEVRKVWISQEHQKIDMHGFDSLALEPHM